MHTADQAQTSSEPAHTAAEALHTLTQNAAALVARLHQLKSALQQSSSNNISSTLQHLALYDEAVHALQVELTVQVNVFVLTNSHAPA